MAFRFEELRVWHHTVDLSSEIDLIARLFPKIELYSLASQMKRAADSVVLNIVEGSTGQSISDYKRFLNMALRSAIEVVACLYLAEKRKYVTTEVYQKCYSGYEVACKMITKLRDSM